MSSTVRTSAGARLRIPIACWLNLVCLDAPLVAVSWQWLFAGTFHVELSGGNRAALFLTAWVIYLADRLADNYSLGRGAPMSLRQEFCRIHRPAWVGALLMVGSADVWVILRFVDRDVFVPGFICGVAAVGYLALNAAGRLWRVLPLKEVAVGALFSLGTVLVPLTHVAKVSGFVPWSCFLFAAVCTLNCISIAGWERDLDVAQHKLSIATVFGSRMRLVVMACVIIAVAAAFSSVSVTSAAWLFYPLCASALFLAALSGFGRRLNRDLRTALADIALLTPLFSLFAQ